MIKYRVKYRQGNGYNCSCCRQTWTVDEDFEKFDDAIDFIDGLFSMNYLGNEIRNEIGAEADREFLEFSEVNVVTYKPELERIIKRSERIKNDLKIKREKHLAEQREHDEKKEKEYYEELKKKYGTSE